MSIFLHGLIDGFLSFTNLNLGSFEELGKKEAYTLCVKVLHSRSFEGMKTLKWFDIFGPDQPVKGCWRSLYKMPIDKRTGDLQWRIVHGAIATNKHVAHLDSIQGKECPFCIQDETLVHLSCGRLGVLYNLLKQWYLNLEECFSFPLFIFGPRYSVKNKQKHVLFLE